MVIRMPSNQGSNMIDEVLEVFRNRTAELSLASEVMWREVRSHGPNSRCECPAIELLSSLYEQGYRLVKE